MSHVLDPTFYRSPADAIAAPPERLAYVAAFDPAGEAKDAMAVRRLEREPSRAGGRSALPLALRGPGTAEGVDPPRP
jgi:methanethiol oxidase